MPKANNACRPASHGHTVTRIQIGLMIAATLLLLLAADRYFDPAPPQD